MNKRIMKKHYLGDYAVKCFTFRLTFAHWADLSVEGFNQNCIDQVIDIVENNHCLMCGWFRACVCADDRYKDMRMTDDVRDKILKELITINGVIKVEASPIFDLNYEICDDEDIFKITLDPDLSEQKKQWFLKYSR